MIQAESYPPSGSVLNDDTFEMDTEMMEDDEKGVGETKERNYMVTDTKDEGSFFFFFFFFIYCAN